MKLPLTFVMSETYAVWTDSDVQAGETNDQGFEYEEEEYTLEDLKDHIDKGYFCEASETPVTNRGVWLNSIGDPDPETATQTVKGLHCDRILDADGKELNPQETEKVWKALVRQSIGEKLEPEAPQLG